MAKMNDFLWQKNSTHSSYANRIHRHGTATIDDINKFLHKKTVMQLTSQAAESQRSATDTVNKKQSNKREGKVDKGSQCS